MPIAFLSLFFNLATKALAFPANPFVSAGAFCSHCADSQVSHEEEAEAESDGSCADCTDCSPTRVPHFTQKAASSLSASPQLVQNLLILFIPPVIKIYSIYISIVCKFLQSSSGKICLKFKGILVFTAKAEVSKNHQIPQKKFTVLPFLLATSPVSKNGFVFSQDRGRIKI